MTVSRKQLQKGLYKQALCHYSGGLVAHIVKYDEYSYEALAHFNPIDFLNLLRNLQTIHF